MGRPPKPTEQKRLLGNPGKRPLPEPVTTLPAAPTEIPAPPRGLRKAGKEAWVRLWSVAHAWLSLKTDWAVLVRLCELHDERAQLLRVIRVSHMTEDLEVLAEVLEERAEGDVAAALAMAGDVGPLLRILFKRVRALEDGGAAAVEAPGSEDPDGRPAGKRVGKAVGKRKRGQAPLTGYFALGSTGQIVLHPAVKSLRLVDAEIRRLESLCGFNPSDRSRLGLAEIKKKSKLEELLEKRQQRADEGGRDEGEEAEN